MPDAAGSHAPIYRAVGDTRAWLDRLAHRGWRIDSLLVRVSKVRVSLVEFVQQQECVKYRTQPHGG